MKQAPVFAGFLALALAFAPAATSDLSVQGAEQELMQMEKDLPDLVMRRDRAAIARLFADDFLGFNPVGQRLTKTQVLAQIASPEAEVDSLRHEQIEVRVYGDAAVATGITVVKGRHQGQEVQGRFRYMHFLVQREGRWQIVAGQSSVIGEE